VPPHNLYGPTEASVDVLGWTADGARWHWACPAGMCVPMCSTGT
jgi:hypothetical protein